MGWQDWLALLSTTIAVGTSETIGARNARDGGTRMSRVAAGMLYASTSVIGLAICLGYDHFGGMAGQIYWLTRHLRNVRSAWTCSS